ncbi:MAG: hypothetical protein JL56_12935 [Desulfotomaculum sp. BICA1-6]|nr:MAG: hypothetical protein VR67_08940 [Peptococcaceae bacterium BRH_c8a]KJS72481.1 MAG: hypothetical protein JL56_12935 [Desulfotomaculum sp. BICA1-6]
MREVERLGIIMAIGLEPAPQNKIRVTLQNVIPSAMTGGGSGGGGGGGGGGTAGIAAKPYRNLSAEGDTVFEALRKLSRESPRQLFFAHNQVIILSEELAREGLEEIIDIFERNPQIRRTTWMLVGRGEMAHLLDVPGRIESSPSQRIFGIINERDLTSQYAVQSLGDFIEQMEIEGTQPYTAVVEAVPNQAVPTETQHSTAEGQAMEPRHNLELNGTAVFRLDKLAGFLNLKESRGLLWVRGKVNGGVIEVPTPDESGKLVSLEILRSKTKLQPEIRDGRILMTVDVEVESNLGETTGPVDLTKPEVINKLEALQADAVRDEIESALAKAQQEYGVDVFGFGETVHRKYPREWKEMKKKWPELFSGVQVEMMVDTKIRRTGLVSNPVESK